MPSKVFNVGSMSTSLSKFFVCCFESMAVKYLAEAQGSRDESCDAPQSFTQLLQSHFQTRKGSRTSGGSTVNVCQFSLLWHWRTTCGCLRTADVTPKREPSRFGMRRMETNACVPLPCEVTPPILGLLVRGRRTWASVLRMQKQSLAVLTFNTCPVSTWRIPGWVERYRLGFPFSNDGSIPPPRHSVSSIPISISTCNGFSNIANMISPWEKKMFLPRLKATAAALPVFSHGTMQLMNLEVNYIFSPVNALASFLHVFLKL